MAQIKVSLMANFPGLAHFEYMPLPEGWYLLTGTQQHEYLSTKATDVLLAKCVCEAEVVDEDDEPVGGVLATI